MPPTSLGNNRNIQLFNLAKPRSQLRDKNTYDLEYEKNCDQCTFNPDMAATNAANSKQLKGAGREVEIKDKDVAINRMRKAYEDNQLYQLKMSRGYFEFKNPNKNTQVNHSHSSKHYEPKAQIGFKRLNTGSPKLDTGLLSS